MEFVHGIIVNPQETLRCSFFGYLKFTVTEFSGIQFFWHYHMLRCGETDTISL